MSPDDLINLVWELSQEQMVEDDADKLADAYARYPHHSMNQTLPE